MAPQNNCWSQITATNIIQWESLKYCGNYQNMTQRHELSKCYWKNGTSRFAQHSVATNLQSVKKNDVIHTKYSKSKCSKTRYSCKNCQTRVVSVEIVRNGWFLRLKVGLMWFADELYELYEKKRSQRFLARAVRRMNMPFTEIETMGGINWGVKMWSSVLDILLGNSNVNVSS